MEELTLSFEEAVRNLHFIPCIEQEILRAFSRKEKWFASHFTIIAACPDRKQALERIFSYGSKSLPKEKWTSLQVLAMQNKKRLGYAMGVIMMKSDV